jgi:dihydrofolate reductase
MAKIVVSQFITLDGVVEDPGGSENMDRGGWAFEYERGAEGDKFKLDEVMGAEALLLGRTTYEGFAEAWPSREGEFADKFNNMPKYVVSDTLTDPEWNNSHVIASSDLRSEVEKLRAEPGGDILVNGSVRLVRALLENDLVDELRLMLYPVVLGQGKTLFDPASGADAKSLKLTSSMPAGDTIVLVYEPR